jgi:hypothetical protein
MSALNESHLIVEEGSMDDFQRANWLERTINALAVQILKEIEV